MSSRFLSISGRTYGQPIQGQYEVVGEYSASSNTEWKVMEGIFVHPSNDFVKTQHHQHTEL